MEFNFSIEEAKVSDLDSVLNIYSYYVEKTTSSLEEKKPTKDEIFERYEMVLSKNLPFLVAKQGTEVIGFCYASPYRKRSAYRYTIEESIYVHKDYARKGIASALVRELIRRCSEIGYKQLIAVVIAANDDASVHFHKSVGFEEKGRLTKVGFKFNTWLDTVLMQKSLEI